MIKTIGFGILGAGVAADYHQQAIAANQEKGARLVAVGHYDSDQFASISRRFGVPCLSEEALLAQPDIQVICLCTPSGQHPAQAMAAARAGKHVLVEKPMALSLSDAEAMSTACAKAGVQLGVVLQRRAELLFGQIRAAIVTGELGELTLGMVTIPYVRPPAYYAQAAWRGTWALDGGGVLMNQGIHLVDLLVWYMGDPVEVKAYAVTLHRDIEVEDSLAATLRFGNGAMATIAATTTAEPGFPHRLEIYGTRGGVQVEGEKVIRWPTARPGQVAPATVNYTAPAGAAGGPRGIPATGHIAIVADFIEALRDGRPPLVDGAEGRRSLAAVLAVYRAAGLRPP
ncbi:MAG: Gfo/Idh/MocA family oxidoreductase [Chloroflexi bacterium]|nr:Gfo/Idh/MocA family oxidoreductase [Chloroflexota bacterium]MCI0578089.1 Gfo/Idh/MocA family oxidoreductase [Chloroflexota bacterium]MCI0646077.1 Gfo/Idh/MocA family oxidoreductase [Chloroflexota bacterium]MCI0730985.1 Gfo/Idh/MocA family oxidoreductase [Chloroflexota bacterium]